MATSNFLSLDVSNETMTATMKKHEKEDCVPAETDNDLQYKEVALEDDWSLTEGEEDLRAAVKVIQDRAVAGAAAADPPVSHQPEAMDDFLRNFLCEMNMTETLECFQTEWTEMAESGLFDTQQAGVVPDVYTENRRLESELKHAQREMEEYRRAACAAAETLGRVQKARDLHRLQHKRVVQEKNRLIEEIRRLKAQCSSYEPAVKRMNEKYQTVLKQTMLLTVGKEKTSGEADRASAQQNSAICRDAGEVRAVNSTGGPRVNETTHPVMQPRPPASAHAPRGHSRVP